VEQVSGLAKAHEVLNSGGLVGNVDAFWAGDEGDDYDAFQAVTQPSLRQLSGVPFADAVVEFCGDRRESIAICLAVAAPALFLIGEHGPKDHSP
jgi:hypothetical protein